MPQRALRRLAFKGFGDGDDAGKIAQFFGVLVERMAGDKEAQHLFFVGEPLAFFPVGDLGQFIGAAALARALR